MRAWTEPGDAPDRVVPALGGEIPAAPGESWRIVAAIEIVAGAQFELLLPKTTLLAGEAVSPRIRVANHSNIAVVVEQPWAWLQTNAAPLLRFAPGFWPEGRPPPSPFALASGERLTWSQAIQLPFEDPSADLAIVQLGASLRSPSPGPAVGNIAAWPIYQAPAVKLALKRSQPAQQLRIHWQADRYEYSVRVTDANGSRPSGGPLVAWMWATSARGATLGALPNEQGHVWSGTWAPHLIADNSQVNVRIWVAGSGWVTALAEAQLPPRE